MSENNRSYRIRTNVGEDSKIDFDLKQDFDILEILSLKIDTDNFYKLHSSKYGCLVGRVLANNSVGVPNAKISAFIAIDETTSSDPVLEGLYPYKNVRSKNSDNIRYNLLPDEVNDSCHQDVGTFPNKRLVLDDYNVIEIYDKYYKYTTTSNNAGDYMLFGLPVGQTMLHMDVDLSDIGVLSQKPRDFYYKGYTNTQFENSSQFKYSTNLDELTQIMTQDESLYVYPFWGDEYADTDSVAKQVRLTRKDINLNYKFEPTCIFIGSLVADEKSQGFSKKCIPTSRMGRMDRLTTGSGTIEMIRKTPDGAVESYSIQGNDLIDGNGTWCYQIPMNLDYMKTDEFGNFVAAESEHTGIPTRTRVRFRISIADYESDTASAHLCKTLVPNNPQVVVDANGNETLPVDYNFGSATSDESFRDLFWNNVYTVKQYIPRIQKIILPGRQLDRNKNFSGIKCVNVNGSNNPIPYNNLRINLTFLFVFQCIIFKCLILIVKMVNAIVRVVAALTCGGGCGCGRHSRSSGGSISDCCNALATLRYVTLDGEMCPALDGWFMALGAKGGSRTRKIVIDNTVEYLSGADNNSENAGGNGGGGGLTMNFSSEATEIDNFSSADPNSSDAKYNNKNFNAYEETFRPGFDAAKVSGRDSYFVKCVELQFAMEYEVIQFDFYNDWINGMLYYPRWFAEIKRRLRYKKIMACSNNFRGLGTSRRYLVQQCATYYHPNSGANSGAYQNTCDGGKCHKRAGRRFVRCMDNSEGGIVREVKNKDDLSLFYLRPAELYNTETMFGQLSLRRFYEARGHKNVKLNLFATDIVLLGNTLDCNKYGIPTAVGYPSSTFVMPPPTGEIVSDSQEMDMSYAIDYDLLGEHSFFYIPNVKDPNSDEGDEIEMSGIDWGYNPFELGGDTTVVKGQVAGHFLEIGCISSMSGAKSCANLQRICELGGEMAQSHYYLNFDYDEYYKDHTHDVIDLIKKMTDFEAKYNTGVPKDKVVKILIDRQEKGIKVSDIISKYGITEIMFTAIESAFETEMGNYMKSTTKKGYYVPSTGIISTREILGFDMRMKFAALNSKRLATITDNDTTYLQYDFRPFTPNKFDGAMLANSNLWGKEAYLYDTKSQSYLDFRLGMNKDRKDTNGKVIGDAYTNHYLISDNSDTFSMPVFENSFYFYFGLKDGSTAIDRLYTEYFSECHNRNEIETLVES